MTLYQDLHFVIALCYTLCLLVTNTSDLVKLMGAWPVRETLISLAGLGWPSGIV